MHRREGVARSTYAVVGVVIVVIVIGGAYFLATGGPAAGSSTTTSSSTPTTTSTTPLVPGSIRLGTFSLGNLPNLSNAGESAEWLAPGLRYFQQEVVNLTIVPLQNSAVILQALQANQIDVADINAQEAFKLQALGQANFTSIMGVGASDCFTCTGGFLIAAKNSITNINQLQGANVGISGAGGNDQLQAIAVLKALGVTYDPQTAINWIPVGTPQARVAGLQAGTLDATITSTQNIAALNAMPSVHMLVNSTTFAMFAPPAVPGMVVKTSFLQSHTPLLQQFVTALIESNRAFAANKTAWVTLAVKYDSAVNATTAGAMYSGFARGFSINGGINATRAQLGVNYYYTTTEFVSQKVPVVSASAFVTTALVDNALKQLGVSSAFDGIGRTVAGAATTTAIMGQALVPLRLADETSTFLNLIRR